MMLLVCELYCDICKDYLYGWGQNLFLAENSEIVILAISAVSGHICSILMWFLLLNKGMHWLGPGSKIVFNEKWDKFKEI